MADGARARHLRKRSFSIAGHRTSVALEEEFWTVLEDEARRARRSLSAFVAHVDAGRGTRPLASALRIAALACAAGFTLPRHRPAGG